MDVVFIILLYEEFGDIMVLASPPYPCPPVDLDDVNALSSKKYSTDLFLYDGRYPPEVL